MALFNYVLSLSLSGSALIGVVVVLRQLFKNCPKKYSYALWLIVFLSLVVRITVPVYIEKPAVIPQEVLNINVENNIDFEHTTPLLTEIEPPAQTVNSLNIAYVWLAGVLILSMLYLKNIVNMLGLLKSSEKGFDGVYYSEYVTSPFTFGIVRPKIYLPYNLLPEDKANIIAHERAHIRRLDYIVKPLCFVISILHWFNPLVWLSFNLMAKDMELSCDEAVIKNLDVDNKKSYCSTLLRFGVNNRYKFSAVLFGEGDCSMRIKNVLNYKQPKRLTAFALAFAVALTGCSTVKAEKEYYLPEAENDEINVILADELNNKGQMTEEKAQIKLEFFWPTAGGVRVSRGFTGQYPSHDGVDIAGASGTEIYAAEDGTVITSEKSTQGDGNCIIIKHSDELETLYAHCDELLVNEGDTVMRGQLIATMGSTGNSTGPHLHFEARRYNKCINPYIIWNSILCPECGGYCKITESNFSPEEKIEEMECHLNPGEVCEVYKGIYSYNAFCPDCGYTFSEKMTEEKVMCEYCGKYCPIDSHSYKNGRGAQDGSGYKGGSNQ